jgi:hypothetical protein
LSRSIKKIHRDEVDARNRLHLQDIEGDNAALGADALCGDRAPATRGGAKIDDARAAFEQTVFVIYFRKLKSRARPKTLALGARHIWIAELALQPRP